MRKLEKERRLDKDTLLSKGNDVTKAGEGGGMKDEGWRMEGEGRE